MSQWPQQYDPGRQPPAPPYPYGQYPPRPHVPPARLLPPYPSRLVRFPVRLLPRARRRGGRGHSLVYYVYLGTHPVAVMVALFATVIAWGLLAEWVLFVVMAWLTWAGLVSAWWLCAAPFAAAVNAARRH